LKGFYKIGISTDLYKRLAQYRCGNVLEPKLHYYYPCKNIKDTDRLLKTKLQKFNVKREIYKADNIEELRNTIKEIQKESGSNILEIIPENKECEIIGCTLCNMFFTNNQDLKIHTIQIHNIKSNIIQGENIETKILKERVDKLVKDIDKTKKACEKMIKNMKKADIKNITINPLGFENLKNKLSEEEQISLITSINFNKFPIIELVEQIYNNKKLKYNRNTYISNLQGDNCFIFNKNKNRFDACCKNKHIDNIIKNRKDDIIKMFEINCDKIEPIHKKSFNEYINNINNKFYKKHKDEINRIIYNARNEIKKNIINKLNNIEIKEKYFKENNFENEKVGNEYIEVKENWVEKIEEDSVVL